MFRYAEIKQVKDKIEWEIKNFGKQTKMERKHNISKFMGWSKKKFYEESLQPVLRKKGRPQINRLILYIKKLEKQE